MTNQIRIRKILNIKIVKIFVFSLGFHLVFSIWKIWLPAEVSAQQISLAISPPLVEVTIAPGKTVTQTFTLINSGNQSIITPKIVYFVPNDNLGGVDLTNTPSPQWVKYNSNDFIIKNEDRVDFNVTFSPNEDVLETDHLLSIVFETSNTANLTNQNSSQLTGQIVSNILVTISADGNPKKSAEVVKFSVPRVIDSLLPITYSLLIKNDGNSFWKPNGKITTNKETLKVAPQNILSGYSRQISCLEKEELIPCQLTNKPFIGIVESELEFTIDDEPKVYKATAKTFVFPFTILTFLLIVIIPLTLYRRKFIFKLWRIKKRGGK